VPAGALDYATSYDWRVRYLNDLDVWSEWSRETGFFTSNGNYRRVTLLPVTGQIEDVLLDETRDRFWVLRRTAGRVECYDLGTGQLIASIRTGLEPESFAMTYDRRYLGVGSRGNIYITVIDLESDLSGELGFYNSGDLQKVFRIAPIGTSDFIFVTRPDSFGSPPQGGHINVWRSDTRQVLPLAWPCAAEHFLFGLPPSDRFLFGGWGYSQGGISLMQYNRAAGTIVQIDEHLAGVFFGASTMNGADPVHNQFVLDNDFMAIGGSSLTYLGPTPYNYSNTRVLFNPANADQAIMSASGAASLTVWDLSWMQPDFSLNLPSGTTWAGKGQFSADGARILVVVNVTGGNRVVLLGPPVPNAYTISAPADGATGVSLVPTLAVTGIQVPAPNHQASQWQVRAAPSPSDWSVCVFDSGATETDLVTISVPAARLDYGASYLVRMRYQPTSGVWSEWCPASHFSTVSFNAELLISHFYWSFLNRPPEFGAVDSWRIGYLDYMLSYDVDVRFIAREMARIFLDSPEYASRNRSNEEFIRDCYMAFLWRVPSQGELDGWLGGIWNRGEAMTIFGESEEFSVLMEGLYPNKQGDPTRNFVTRMYIGAFDRLVDSGGLLYWADVLNQAVDKRAEAKEMALLLFTSAEYIGMNQSTESTVIRLYRAFMGRFPGDEEIAYWAGELNSGGLTLQQVITFFAGSPEFTGILHEFFGAAPAHAEYWTIYR